MKIITINIPETQLQTLDDLIGKGADYESRSEFYRQAIGEYIVHLKTLKEDMIIDQGGRIITVNLPVNMIADIAELTPDFLAGGMARSEFIRNAGMMLIEKEILKGKDVVVKKTFDEELQEYTFPIIKNEAYKTYKVVKQ